MTLDILIGMALGLFLGWLLLQYVVFRTLRRFEQTVTAAMTRAEPTEKLILARAELTNNTFYLWNIENGAFLAQGTNHVEIMEHLKQRHDLLHSQVKVIEGDQDVLDRLRAADGA